MADTLSPRQRDALFAKLKDDPKFRDQMKKDWRSAMSAMKIKPEAIVKGVLSRQEIEQFPGQSAAWTIEIVISGKVGPDAVESIATKEAINFAARK
jgi:hypothetical protein